MGTHSGDSLVCMYVGQHAEGKDKYRQGSVSWGKPRFSPSCSERASWRLRNETKRMLSVRAEEVIRHLRGCLEEGTSFR